MKMHFKGFLAATAFGVLALTFAPQARATAELKLSDGTNTVDILDNGVAVCTGAVTGCSDANVGTNVVTFVGTIGTWSLNVSTGASHGASAGTDLDLNSVNSTTAASTLTISFSDSGFPVSATGESFHVGGTLQGPITVAYTEYSGATKFAQTTQIGATLTFTSSPFAGSTSGIASGGALTEVAVLTATGSASTSFDAALTPVPEPASVALFGGALLFIGGALRRKVRKA